MSTTRKRLQQFQIEANRPLTEAWGKRAAHPSQVRRAAATALVGALKVPALNRIAATIVYDGLPIDYDKKVGSGNQQLVYFSTEHDNTVVHKVQRGSCVESFGQAEERAGLLNEEFLEMQQICGRFILEASYSVIPSTKKNFWMVVAQQTYKPFLEPIIENKGSEPVAVDHSVTVRPSVLTALDNETELQEFTKVCRSYHRATGNYIDLLRTDNLMLDDGTALMVDNRPITKRFGDVNTASLEGYQERIEHALHVLEAAV